MSFMASEPLAEEKAMLIDWAKGLSQKIQMTEGGNQPK